MGNVLKRKCSKTNEMENSAKFELYRKRNKSLPKAKAEIILSLDEENKTNAQEGQDVDETDSWTTTIGTRSDFSLSCPTDDSESDERCSGRQNVNSRSHSCNCESSSTTSSSEISNTSEDFSSLRNLSEISEHTTMPLRSNDIAWMKAVQTYNENEPIFRKKPFKAALKIRPRKLFPRYRWHQLYHQWAIRQPPMLYRGDDAYINKVIVEQSDIDLAMSDLSRGILYYKSSKC